METKAADGDRNYGADEWRRPDIEPGDEIVFSEHGRVLPGGSNYNVDYRSHWFLLVKREYGGHALIVKHGGGQERIQEHALRKVAGALALLESDNRYLMLYALYQMYREARTKAKQETADEYRRYFVEGRLKKRKRPGQNSFKVWIEPTKGEL